MPVSDDELNSQNFIVSIGKRVQVIDRQKKDEYIPLGCLLVPRRGGWISSFPAPHVWRHCTLRSEELPAKMLLRINTQSDYGQ